VYATFVEAFSDYAVDMRYNTEPGFAHRAVKNSVEFGSSVAPTTAAGWSALRWWAWTTGAAPAAPSTP